MCNKHEGSSPQVRGTSPEEFQEWAGSGIIPAGAGHFGTECAGIGAQWDHPRRCGALVSGSRSDKVCQGSSPQVRGT